MTDKLRLLGAPWKSVKKNMYEMVKSNIVVKILSYVRRNLAANFRWTGQQAAGSIIAMCNDDKSAKQKKVEQQQNLHIAHSK